MKVWLHNIRNRKLAQWTLAYVAVAWGVIQVVDLVADRFSWPPLYVRLLIVVAAAGFAVAVIIAWFHGEKGRQRVSLLEAMLLLLVVCAALVAAARTVTSPLQESTPSEARLAGLAVLPLENLSAHPDSVDYIVDGLHVELLTQLAKIRSIRVIGRSSVVGYSGRDAGVLRQIRDDLGVRHVLEGAVRIDGARLRVDVRLADAITGATLWAEDYDGNLLDVFGIQNSIASEVAFALRAEVTPRETERLATRPTRNIDAYKYYLRGAAVKFAGYVERDILLSIQMYQNATLLDSTFTAAFARLAAAHADSYWFVDPSTSRAAAARAALERAVALSEADPETCLASAVYAYRIRRDYPAARRALDCALDGLPGDSRVQHLLAAVTRRSGQWNDALAAFTRAFELEPRSAANAMEVGITLWLMRSYGDAESYLARALDLDPSFPVPWSILSLVRFARSGDPKLAIKTLEDAERAGIVFADDPLLQYTFIQLHFYARQYEDALRRIELEGWEVFDYQWFYLPASLVKGQLAMLGGDTARAALEFEASRVMLELHARNAPDDPRIHSSLGLTYALLGRKPEAVASAERAAALLPVERDAWLGAFLLEDLALTYTVVGDLRRAAEVIVLLMSRPGPLSTSHVRLDPRLHLLRAQPAIRSVIGG